MEKCVTIQVCEDWENLPMPDKAEAQIQTHSEPRAIHFLAARLNVNSVRAILYNPHHTLHALLTPKSEVSHNYPLRQRVHDRLLP